MIEFFTQAYKDVSLFQIILEIIAFVFGILSVYYAKKENILVYPSGLICTIISVYLLYNVQYYGDMVINIYYSIMSIYGWILWQKKVENKVLKISNTTKDENKFSLFLFLITIIFTFCVYLYFDKPILKENYLDIFTTGIFFTAMYLMAKKKIESWILWIIGDLITIPLYANRGLGILSLQYLVFTIMAILAFKEWKKQLIKKDV